MKRRFHFFPSAFPDETLHSILSRLVRLDGLCLTNGVFPADLLELGCANNVPFPCHLSSLLELLPAEASLTVPEIISRHTHLPYYQPFLTVGQLQAALNQMSVGSARGLKLRLGITASRLESSSRIRFCRDCITQDADQHGVAYWHRVHQLPGVWICPHHSCLLAAVDHRKLSRCRKRVQLPGDDEVQENALLPDVGPEHYRTLIAIALSSLNILQANESPCPAWKVQSVLLDGAKSLGLASVQGRLHLQPLARHMNSFFAELPCIGEYSILRKSSSDELAQWVTKILRKPRRTRHPLKVLLMATAMKVDLLEGIRSDRQLSDKRPASHQINEKLVALQSRSASVVAAGVASKQQNVLLMAMRGDSAGEIAASSGFSVASVYRIIRAQSHGTLLWNQARYAKELAFRRDCFISQYQHSLARECCDYSWLYRHDRDWLIGHIQSGESHRSYHRNSRAVEELDTQLAKQVFDCSHRLRTTPGKPVRITIARIGRELDVVSKFEKHLARLPLCTAALAAVCENRDDFHRRRLEWARQELENNDQVVTHSSLYRTASIRPPNETGCI
ncbi:TnsD family Tn7-like transposition protein [Salinicola sp. V024]|uniref:TnsD family Tn7-like transposition protein n=1 Tax=Salinicola sp. V024 TaxID=3459609 RepID=UPI00404496C5